MFFLSARRSLLFPSVALALLAVGCGSGVKLVAVKGKATLAGAPLTAGNVNFTPDTAKGNTSVAAPNGKIESDGTYTLNTEGKPGAPLGWYKVTVFTKVPGGPENAPEINSRYSSPGTSDLSIEVVANPSPTQYDLTLSN